MENYKETLEDYGEKLEQQLLFIKNLMAKVKKNLSRMEDVPNCWIRIGNSNGRVQYRLVDKQTKETKYVKSKDVYKLKKIAQKQYSQAVYQKLLNNQHAIEKFLKNYNVNKIHQEYNKMAEGRKVLVTPIIETDELYRINWLDDEYESMPFVKETEFYTNNGIRVRSKSELIIANLLEQYDIPYKYEKPLVLKGIGKIRPDFICLNSKTHQEYVWEHFGMMDNADYANKNVVKLHCYQQNGYYPGVNMIVSFETSAQPISSKNLKKIIEQYLL
ncbi:hypothetical protein SAMN04487761_11433 [Lachnospiraceae bacterium C7]|nr:hypothetical protein SAMN04487761_11433 [Lachnospiraceae bacterium C7]